MARRGLLRLAACVVQSLLRDGKSGVKFETPLKLLTHHLMLREPGCNRCLGICESKAIAFLVDDKEYVSLLDELVVPNLHVADVTRHIRRDRDDLGSNSCIPSPWRIKIILHQVVTEKARDNQHHECKQDPKGNVHRISPCVL